MSNKKMSNKKVLSPPGVKKVPKPLKEMWLSGVISKKSKDGLTITSRTKPKTLGKAKKSIYRGKSVISKKPKWT